MKFSHSVFSGSSSVGSVIQTKCPLAAGQSVFRARSLLTLITDTTFSDKDICAVQGIFFKKDSAAIKQGQPDRLELSLLPNPAKDYVYVQAKQKYEGEVEIMVTDYTGKVVLHEHATFVSNRIKIPTNHFSTGVYIIRVNSKDGLHYDARFNVQQ